MFQRKILIKGEIEKKISKQKIQLNRIGRPLSSPLTRAEKTGRRKTPLLPWKGSQINSDFNHLCERIKFEGITLVSYENFKGHLNINFKDNELCDV